MKIILLSLLGGIALSIVLFFIFYLCMRLEFESDRLSIREDLFPWIVGWSPFCTILVMGMNDLICNHDVVAFLALIAFVAPVIIADQFSKKKKEVEKAQNRIKELEQTIHRQDKEISEMKAGNSRL